MGLTRQATERITDQVAEQSGRRVARENAAMLGWHRDATADGVSRRIAVLRDELDDLQSSLWAKGGGLERVASEAQDWISERAEALPRINLPEMRRQVSKHLPTPTPSLAVVAAALVVGAGVGCVLYALTSGSKGRPAGTGPKDGVRRTGSKVAE